MTTLRDIPAFSMWKSLNDTISFIKKAESWEAGVDKLAKIIRDYSNILFICSREPHVTFEQYQVIQETYKTFTIWLLGQFFYLLGHDKFNKAHDVIIETQVYILDQLSNTLLHVYQELSEEYKKMLKLMVGYLRNPQDNLLLEVFVPQNLDDLSKELNLNQVFIQISSKEKCFSVLLKLMKFIKFILIENFMFYSFDHNTCEVLDNLIFLFSEAGEKIKLQIVDIFVELTKLNSNFMYNPDINLKLLLLSSLFQQFTYHVYDTNILLNEDMKKFENYLVKYINTKDKIFFKNISQISKFLFNKSLNTSKGISPSEEIKIIITKHLEKTFNEEKIKNISEIVNFSNSELIFCLKEHIYRNIETLEVFSDYLKVFKENTNETWYNIYNHIMSKVDKLNCLNNCQFSDFLKFCNNLNKMLIQINLKLMKSKNRNLTLCYFDERELLSHFIKKSLVHFNQCTKVSETLDEVLQFFITFTLLTNSKNINIIFQILGFPLLKSYCYKSDNQFSNNFIGERDVGDIRSMIRSFYKYLNSQNITDSLSLQLLNKLFVIISTKLVTLNSNQLKDIANLYFKISKGVFESSHHDEIILVST